MMNAPTIFIFGAGGHAKVVAEILRLSARGIAGFIDNVNTNRKGESFCGSFVLGGVDELQRLKDKGITTGIVAFGDNRMRLEVGQSLVAQGFSLAKAIHPSAIIAASVEIGAGTVVAAGAVIGPSVKIGSCTILNTQAAVDHDCTVRDGAHVGPGALVTGGVDVGERAWIGAGAIITDHKSIGSDSIVGAGAVVVEQVPARVVVMGVPAKLSKTL